MKKRLKMIIISICIIIAVCIGIFGYYTYITRTKFVTTEYKVESEKIKKEIRIAQISDVHNKVFGKDNIKLVEAVSEIKPNIICLNGDLFSRNTTNYNSTLSLVASLKEIAPVYYSMGNHERDYCRNNKVKEKDLLKEFSDAGAITFDHEFIDTTICNNPIRIGGLSGYCVSPDKTQYDKMKKEGRFPMDWSVVWNNGADYCFLKDFEETDSFRLLISHQPECFVLWDSFDYYESDLILSGHFHGGQFVLPFIGPLFSPAVGLFPEKETIAGMHHYGDSTIIISKGIGSHGWIPRVNNIGEILSITIAPK